MKSFPYKCKFCGADGQAHCAADPAMFDITLWLSKIACNRCADYHDRRITLGERISKLAVFVLRKRQGGITITPETEGKLRERLTNLTKEFARIVCYHYRKPTIWEPDFVQLIIDKPDRTDSILTHYIKGVRP